MSDMADVFYKYKNARSLRDYIHSLDFDETYDQIVNLAYTTDIQFEDENKISDIVHLFKEYHFEANEATSLVVQERINESLESTDSNDIERQNRKIFAQLQKYTPTFVRILKRTDFEDGMTNYVSDVVEDFIKSNSFVTYSWLATIYSSYQKDAVVLAGLLRIIELTIRNEDVDILLPIVKAGLADKSSMVQEAAIMVIEQWRTKNCLEALETSTFHSKMIEVYANQIIEELKEELL